MQYYSLDVLVRTKQIHCMGNMGRYVCLSVDLTVSGKSPLPAIHSPQAFAILVALVVVKIISFVGIKSRAEVPHRRLIGHAKGAPIFETVKPKSD